MILRGYDFHLFKDRPASRNLYADSTPAGFNGNGNVLQSSQTPAPRKLKADHRLVRYGGTRASVICSGALIVSANISRSAGPGGIPVSDPQIDRRGVFGMLTPTIRLTSRIALETFRRRSRQAGSRVTTPTGSSGSKGAAQPASPGRAEARPSVCEARSSARSRSGPLQPRRPFG